MCDSLVLQQRESSGIGWIGRIHQWASSTSCCSDTANKALQVCVIWASSRIALSVSAEGPARENVALTLNAEVRENCWGVTLEKLDVITDISNWLTCEVLKSFINSIRLLTIHYPEFVSIYVICNKLILY